MFDLPSLPSYVNKLLTATIQITDITVIDAILCITLLNSKGVADYFTKTPYMPKIEQLTATLVDSC